MTSSVYLISISVRSLVEFIMRSGNIDNRRKASSGPEVMLEGANIHRMIQRRMGSNYHPEVYLSCTVSRRDYEIVIDGRADGIIVPEGAGSFSLPELRQLQIPGPCEDTEDNEQTDLRPLLFEEGSTYDDSPDMSGLVVIDEIKTTARELEHIKKPACEHLAQAKCYAYMVAKGADLPAVGVRMTYCNTETKELRYFDSIYTREEIEEWFAALLSSYVRFSDHETSWRKIRNASISSMEFPFSYRPGQRELMAQVYSSIEKGQELFVMAPTGVGKTIANVYPSLKALSLGLSEKIFYLTAKTITRKVAADCLALLRSATGGLRVKSVTLTAKEKICPMEKCECEPDKCPYAKGHFDRINDAIYDMLVNEDDFSRDVIISYSDKHMVCPFEYSLDMSLFSDMVICDYNYVFDPNVYLRRFFSENVSGDYLFLIDEAHNLVERGMKMYSAKLVKEHFLDMKRLVKDYDRRLASSLESCNRYLLSLKRQCEDVLVVDDFESFIPLLLRLCGRIEQFLDDREHFAGSDKLLEFYFGIRHFLNIYENMDQKDYVQYAQFEGSGDFAAELMCANPGKRIAKCTGRARSSVFFSATLLPIDYYRTMLGATDDDPAVYAKSVFDPAKRELIVAKDVTSKYTRRSDSEYDRMAEYISTITTAKEGNYMVFFPSFAMLGRVHEIYMNRYHDSSCQEVIVQQQVMSESEREGFLDRFDAPRTPDEPSLCGFCVLGGIFSEGIDLKNDALIGAVIIGTGLPMVCQSRQLLKRCYDDTGLDGFDYAYRFPGMNKVMQAAGRVIRTEEDRGVVALLDERFLGRDYMRLFPREWEGYKTCRIDDIGEILEGFWGIC